MWSLAGEPARFPTPRKAQGFAGLFPETDATGFSDRKGTHITKLDRRFSDATFFSPPITFARLDPDGARLYHDLMVLRENHHNSALCTIANRMLIPRILTVLRKQRPYEFRSLDGTPITKAEARELAAQWKVTEEVRKRLRDSKPSAQAGNGRQTSRASQWPLEMVDLPGRPILTSNCCQ